MRESYYRTKVTYTLKVRDKLVVVENVPARVCRETGEQFFAPETVQHLHAVVAGHARPRRTIETPVFDYAP
jgi:YgiT-type zinc finger domain-containing protein